MRMKWNDPGTRLFETGIDRGVLFTTGGKGIPWNGLRSVKENSSGAETNALYLDGLKYLEVPGREDFGGTIEAYTYPEAFGYHDGTLSLASGLSAMQQRRRPFGLSYRTRIGDDTEGADHGYKIHLVYNVLAQPSDREYTSMGNTAEPFNFSWGFSTTPKRPTSETPIAPTAHLVIDSRNTSAYLLRYIEELIYGSSRQDSAQVSMDEIFRLFESPQFVYSIFADRARGLSRLVTETDGTGDLIGDPETGVYEALSESRLVPTNKPGMLRLSDAPTTT